MNQSPKVIQSGAQRAASPVFLLVFLLIFQPLLPVDAATLIVSKDPNDTGSHVHRTFKHAYDNASNGDTIIVRGSPGLFLETASGNNLFTKRLSIINERGPAVVTLNIAPANDAFSTPTSITGDSITALAYNYTATNEPGEPFHAGFPPAKTLWWSWTSPSDGLVAVSTIGSVFDTVLAVYTGSTLPSLSLVASDSSSRSRVLHFYAHGGTTYLFAVGGKDAAGYGLILLNLSFSPAPNNNNFANRITLTGTAAFEVGNNAAANSEPSEPVHWTGAAGKSAWYSWTAPISPASLAGRPVAISTFGSSFDTVLAVYTGNAVNALTLVTANDNAETQDRASRVVFTPTPGTTYQIAVDGLAPFDSGTFALSVDYSLVNLAPDPTDPPRDLGGLQLGGSLCITNYGPGGTSPLQVRLLAVPACVLGEGVIEIKDLQYATPVSTSSVPVLGGLASGQGVVVPISGAIPAPTADTGWIILGLLEESFGAASSNRLVTDNLRVLLGDFTLVSCGTSGAKSITLQSKPSPKSNSGVLRPYPVLPPSAATVEYFDLAPVSAIAEGETTALIVLGHLDTGEVGMLTNGINWILPGGVTQGPDGLLHFPFLPFGGTNLTISGSVDFNGLHWILSPQSFSMLKRPSLTASFAAANTLHLVIRGQAGKLHQVEWASVLAGTNWQAGSSTAFTNRIPSNGVWDVYDQTATGQTRFYRIRRLEQ